MKEELNHIVSCSFGKTILLITLFFSSRISFTQCISPITGFPYTENFEASNGNWTTGGTFSDWQWGTPSKSVINSAGEGLKCWITGGVNVQGYTGDQQSWLKSPCFNFTNLKHPYLKFKVFWETEGKNDGANLQYSIDQGVSWQVIGSRNEVNPCLTEKWYNDGPLTSLGNQDAWCGNMQSSKPPCIVSGGSAGWVTAKHNVPNLAGNPSVIFRFVFASNSGCNDFDGFAIDEFTIEEAPPSTASFSYNCSSNLRVNFINTSTLCPTSFLWDFGDPSSGDNNVSTLQNPTHAYTAGGNYDVSLTVSGPGNTSSKFTLHKLQIIENMIASIVTPIRCHDDTTGSVTVNFIGDSSAIGYSWDTDPIQTTRTAVHLGAGDYNVTILNKEGCPASAHISLGEPPPLLYKLTTIKPNCAASNGSILITMLGGDPPYSYNWLPNVSNTSSATDIPSGQYTVTVTDNNGCYKIINLELSDAGNLVASISVLKPVSCFGGNDGMAIAGATGGTGPYTYLWSPAVSNSATINNLAAGDHSVVVTDANGCKAISRVNIQQPSAITSITKIENTFCGNDNGIASVKTSGGVGPYQYSWNPGNFTYDSVSGLAPGQYMLTIKDKNGCIKTNEVMISASSPVFLEVKHTDVLCAGDHTGRAEVGVTGGTAPYSFQWINGIQSYDVNPIANLIAGVYELKVRDAVGCLATSSLTIKEPEALKVDIATTSSYCEMTNGAANAAISGGVPPYSYTWAPGSNTTAALNNVVAGNYQLTVTDKNNCTASANTAIININPSRVFLGDDTTLCPGNKITLSPGVYNSYKWQDYSVAADYRVSSAGIYTVEVTDSLGCVLKDTIKIISDCGLIFFPNAFTPNNDLHNDWFGPAGYLQTVKDYSLTIFNRQGQVVFRSTDPFQKWNGKTQGRYPLSGTYVWVARYSNRGQRNILQKGTVTVIY